MHLPDSKKTVTNTEAMKGNLIRQQKTGWSFCRQAAVDVLNRTATKRNGYVDRRELNSSTTISSVRTAKLNQAYFVLCL